METKAELFLDLTPIKNLLSMILNEESTFIRELEVNTYYYIFLNHYKDSLNPPTLN